MGNAERKLHRLLATENGAARLVEELGTLRIEPELVRPADINRLLGADAVHQGLYLEADPLAYALAKSPLCTRLFTAPGNPGTARHGENRPELDVADHGAVRAFCEAERVGLVVIGPEAPLVAGLVDDLTRAGIRAFGPTRAAAQLEGSKGFTKALCSERGIPTAGYG
ncbi:hypothetical protein FV219_26895, partial [Methylobacterium sp. WL122]